MVDIELTTATSGYDRKTCWVHARAGAIPADPPIVVMTMQKLRLTGSDVFYELNEMRTDDGGQTWTEPTPHPDTLGRRPVEGGIEEGISDFWPKWHEQSGVLLGTGHTVRYLDDNLHPHPRARSSVWTVYDPQARTWTPWRKLHPPDEVKFFDAGAGSTQRVDLPDGDILLPIYFAVPGTTGGVWEAQYAVTVTRCRFDGETLTWVEHGDEFTMESGRGMAEPSLAQLGDRFFLTIRNDDAGYVTSGPDGLHFGEPQPWTFDDGSDLGNYNTQQHWVTTPDALYLVYTRRGANNDHVMRHRAPLFMAQVDPERLCVLRDTEVVVVPERGARLGNFGVTRIAARESWITVTEWMQTGPPDPHDSTVCERYGADNSVFVAKVRFD